jgi:hypothetical protein
MPEWAVEVRVAHTGDVHLEEDRYFGGFHCEVWQVGREGLGGTSFRCGKLSDDAE